MAICRYFILSLFCVGLSFNALPAHAGAWTLDPKSRLIISTTIIDRADRTFGPDSNEDEDPNFNKLETGLYIEQGLTPKITLIGQSSFQTVSFNNGSEQVDFNGFGNSSLGVRYGVYKSNKQVVSVEAHGIINGGGEDIPDGDFGRGGVSIEVRGLYGRNLKLGSKPAFVDFQVAARSQLNENPDQWRTDLTAGIQVTDKILLLGQGFYKENNGSLEDPFDPIFSTKSLKGQISAVYWFRPKYGLQLGAFKTLWGENVVDEEALVLGFWQKF